MVVNALVLKHLAISIHNADTLPLVSKGFEKSCFNFNTLAPGRCCCYSKFVIIQIHIKYRYLDHFLWNCPQVNAIRPYWWLVNFGSGNGSVPSGNKPYLSQCWPKSMSSYGITKPQWVKQLDTLGCILSTVAIDVLVLKHQVISNRPSEATVLT